MTTYRTPDVYVEEISVFPPSVAEVETAVPAFIGFTEYTKSKDSDVDLINIPTKIKSLLEYKALFGEARKPSVTSVTLDANNNFMSAVIDPSYYLYDSLRLFFDNGGGKCYIVAVGTYNADTATKSRKDMLLDGLDKIKRMDEPTILLFPDAAALDASDMAEIQKRALKQCGDLGDRVALLDTVYYDKDSKDGHDAVIEKFRSQLGINNLKYGAAYAPWLKVSYSKNVGYAEIKGSIAGNIKLPSLTGDPEIKEMFGLLDKALDDKKKIADAISSLAKYNNFATTTVNQHMEQLLKDYAVAEGAAVAAGDTPSPPISQVEELMGYVTAIVKVIDDWATSDAFVNGVDGVKKKLEHEYTPHQPAHATPQGVKPSLTSLIKELEQAIKDFGQLDASLAQWFSSPPYTKCGIDTALKASWKITSSTLQPKTLGSTDKDKYDAAISGIKAAFLALSNALIRMTDEAENWCKEHEKFLYDHFPTYRNIIKGVNGTLTHCPPSGAIAGIYALMDSTRGVWKAPANVSLNGVIEPAYYFDQEETDNLNIDPVAGKSINAIRAFSGKGTLVWGARTLAGNDNEWRYVPVRRFFNMVEESVKKSTYWAVFEPNDANTWVRVRGMIENYLTQKWREGALAGATTKEAFFVRCGLGVTMSAQDILNGYMNVEIGMAAVRPAEFIVLKFSHKLQTS